MAQNIKKIKRVLVAYYARNYGTLKKLKKILRNERIKSYYEKRESEKRIKKLLGNVDGVIVLGGDGTLLRISHLVQDTPVLHVSSNQQKNEAFFASATKKNIEGRIRLIREAKYRITELPRLEAKINKRRLPFTALNEVYAGSAKAYNTARYVLRIGKIKEEQKSSGIIVATPAGTNAWLKSAGGKKLRLNEERIQYVVREPYFGRLTKPKLLKGILEAGRKIEVTSKMWKSQKGVVVLDSCQTEFPFNMGDKLTVTASGKKFRLIVFSKSGRRA